MTENYLHFLWRSKRLPFHLFRTTENKRIHVLKTGTYNTASGPDFFNGQLEIDGIVHVGNIELHLKSSDWYKHNHQNDSAYSNVILHVVLEHDREVVLHGEPIPTLELKSYIDQNHLKKTMRLIHPNASLNTVISCANQLEEFPAPVLWSQVQQSLIQRMDRKAYEIQALANLLGNDPRNLLFQSIAKSFGMKTNKIPFQELAHRLPFRKLIKSSKLETEAIVFGTSGLLNAQYKETYPTSLCNEWLFQQHRLNIHKLQALSWHFKGCRPAGFPTLRLAQFAAFVNEMDWHTEFWELPASQIKTVLLKGLQSEPSDYWKTHYHFGKQKANSTASELSLESANTILINSIVPFLWWLSTVWNTPIYRKKALEMLESMPAEKNTCMEQWRELKIQPKSAADSQGLLELLNEFCTHKYCLNCKIGLNLLNR